MTASRTHEPVRSRLLLATLAIALGVSTPAAAFGPRERVDTDPLTEVAMLDDYVDREIRIIGTLGVYGSMPRTYLGLLTGPDSPLVELTGDLLVELSALQGRIVAVTGILRRTAVGPGMPARLEVTAYRVDYRSEKR